MSALLPQPLEQPSLQTVGADIQLGTAQWTSDAQYEISVHADPGLGSLSEDTLLFRLSSMTRQEGDPSFMRPALLLRNFAHQLRPLNTTPAMAALFSEGPREDEAAPAISEIDSEYVFEDRPAVSRFIIEHGLRGLLSQAAQPLRRAFGDSAIRSLRLVTDDEGSATLFCLVMVPGDLARANRALERFDRDWWLARCDLRAGLLNFDFELV